MRHLRSTNGRSRKPLLLLLPLFFPCAAGAATITVNGTADTTANDGVCTLREAIIAANTNTPSGTMAGECAAGQPSPTVDTIAFAIPGSGVHTITLASSLPDILDPVTIDGYTQPRNDGSGLLASPNTLAVGNNAVILIKISGASGVGIFRVCNPTGCGGPGVGDGSTIRGLSIVQASGGGTMIVLSSNNDLVAGNFIGLDTDGATLGGFNTAVQVSAGMTGNTIGGTSPAARNVIASSNAPWIILSDGNNMLVQGNYIGVNAAGTAALGAGATAVKIEQGSGNTIGGTVSGAGNVINATVDGISIGGVCACTTNNNSFQGNLIGTNATGTAALNALFHGIVVAGSTTNLTIGGSTVGAGNVITARATGIIVVQTLSGIVIEGNKIGTDITGTAALGNGNCGIDIGASFGAASTGTVGGLLAGQGNVIAFNGTNGISVGSGNSWAILGNSIHDNGRLGITLGGRCDDLTAMPTPNDACDADTGPNNLQNYPVLTTASSSGGSTNIQGTLNSTANTAFRVEFFSNGSCDSSGNGEGQTYLGFTNVTTDGSCNASFNVTLPVAVSPQTRLTATATDPAGNTSEFSACTSLQAQYHTVTPCRVADTRGPTGAYGGPALAANADRTFVIGGQCGIPTAAQAVSFNYTITQPTDQGDLRSFPGGGALPVVSTMNWRPGQTRANNAIIPLGPSGDVVIHVDQATGTVHFIIDVNGYFE
jgi:CSLREA domain-containing protein